MPEWSRSGPTRCDEPITAGDTVILDVGHQRSRAVTGESYNLAAAAVALRPVEAAAPARCTWPRLVGGMGYHKAGSLGVSAGLDGSSGRRRVLSRR